MASVDFWEAGPGSYNISHDLTSRSQIYLNPPRPIISKGRKNPSMFISNAQSKEWQGTCSPSLNQYSPNTTLLYKSSSVPKFGSERRKDHFSIGTGRSPGPMYSFPNLVTRACSFGKGVKLKGVKKDGPSPDTYDPHTTSTRLPIKIKGYESGKVYAKSYEKYFGGQLGPGPGGYLPVVHSGRGVGLAKAKRMPEGN